MGERDVQYAVAGHWLGTLLVVVEGGVLMRVDIGHDERSVIDRLARREASASAGNDALRVIDRLVQWIDAGLVGPFDVPYRADGTAFQRRVWDALLEIPAGATKSYGQIARELDAVGAARAVGAACGANPLAPVIPCHRVVAADGSLTGYGWGIERKRTLLDFESTSLFKRQAHPPATAGC